MTVLTQDSDVRQNHQRAANPPGDVFGQAYGEYVWKFRFDTPMRVFSFFTSCKVIEQKLSNHRDIQAAVALPCC